MNEVSRQNQSQSIPKAISDGTDRYYNIAFVDHEKYFKWQYPETITFPWAKEGGIFWPSHDSLHQDQIAEGTRITTFTGRTVTGCNVSGSPEMFRIFFYAKKVLGRVKICLENYLSQGMEFNSLEQLIQQHHIVFERTETMRRQIAKIADIHKIAEIVKKNGVGAGPHITKLAAATLSQVCPGLRIQIVSMKPGDHALLILGQGKNRVLFDPFAQLIARFPSVLYDYHGLVMYKLQVHKKNKTSEWILHVPKVEKMNEDQCLEVTHSL